MDSAERSGARSKIAVAYFSPELQAAGVETEDADGAILAEDSSLDLAVRARIAFMAYREELHEVRVDELTPVLAALVLTDIVYEEGVANDEVPELDVREREALAAMLEIGPKQLAWAKKAFEVIHRSRPYLIHRLEYFLEDGNL